MIDLSIGVFFVSDDLANSTFLLSFLVNFY